MAAHYNQDIHYIEPKSKLQVHISYKTVWWLCNIAGYFTSVMLYFDEPLGKSKCKCTSKISSHISHIYCVMSYLLPNHQEKRFFSFFIEQTILLLERLVEILLDIFTWSSPILLQYFYSSLTSLIIIGSYCRHGPCLLNKIKWLLLINFNVQIIQAI